MAFKIIDNPEFTRDVPVRMPDGSEQTLVTSFRGMPDDEQAEFDLGRTGPLKDFLSKAIVAFEKVEGSDGAETRTVPGEALFERIIAAPYVRIALTTDYFAAMTGAKGNRRGN